MSDVNRESGSWYLHYHEDGLLDIFVGLVILFSSQFIRSDLIWMAGIYIPILFPSWKSARKRFIHNRVGENPFDSQENARGKKITANISLLLGGLALTGVGIFFTFIFLSGFELEWLRSYFLLVLGCVFAGIWAFMAILLKLPRFFVYSFFSFLSFTAIQYNIIPFWVALAFIGVVTTLGGLIYLIRFIQTHPTIKNGG